MCIDLFRFNGALDISYLHEQIWFESDQTQQDHLQITEVYDIQIRNTGQNDTLQSLRLLFPRNFTEIHRGSRRITGRTELIGEQHHSRFDWAYRGEFGIDNESEFVHGRCLGPPEDLIEEQKTSRALNSHLGFCSGLSSESLDLFAQAEITPLEVTFDGLGPGESGWIRIILEPVSESTIRRQKNIPGTSLPFSFQEYRTVSSPQVVRERVNYRLAKLVMKLQPDQREALLTWMEAIRPENTPTRIKDHRIAVLFDNPFDIDDIGTKGKIQRCGTFQIMDGTTGILWTCDNEPEDESGLSELIVRLLHTIESNPGIKRTTLLREYPHHEKHELLTALLDAMIELTLVDDRDGKLSAIDDWVSRIAPSLCGTLRNMITTPQESPLSRFSELSPFQVDYRVTWLNPNLKSTNLFKRLLSHLNRQQERDVTVNRL